MDHCQIDGIDELKTLNDVQHETNIKSIKHVTTKKNTSESDHRTSKRKSDVSNSNTLKKKKKYETALAAIFPENDQSYSQYAQDYAEGYMKKMRERLDAQTFEKAVKLVASFGDVDDNTINQLYQEITDLFTDRNEDLIYEFLGFLLPGQALSIGKFADYLELTRIKDFIRKLQVCMKKQPTQVRKILDNLSNLSKCENVTPLEVHTIMLPLLKSNPILVDCFFQLIHTERPPDSFFSDDNWEDLDIDLSITCGIDYEEITPSDLEDHTLLSVCNCHCVCHKSGENTHCRSCGLKFFKGRIYFDSPEGLKLAKINFEGADQYIVQSKIDKTEKNVTVKQKNRKGLTKNSSPGSAEDIKGSTGTESEEDLIDVKPKKRQKSKVVQSLKLKFKKEDSPKCKDELETCNESGKSIVHVNNEELNSSEMVFFCIPKAESNVKVLAKKKLKVEVKENMIQKETASINQLNNESSDDFKSVVLETNSEMKTENSLDINVDNSITRDKKTEFKLPSTVTSDNATKIDIKSEQYPIPKLNEIEENQSSIIECKTNTENFLDTNIVNSISRDIKTEFKLPSTVTSDNATKIDIKSEQYPIPKLNEIEENQSLVNKSDISENCNSCGNLRQTNLDESCKNKIKNEFVVDPETSIKSNKKPDEQNTSVKFSADCNSSTKPTSTAIDVNESLLDKNITKNEIVESLPSSSIDIDKFDKSESEKQLMNKWTIDEDKIILQTCKRVEDIEVLLETIKRRIPQRSVSEIQDRFTTLMALLEQMIVKHS